LGTNSGSGDQRAAAGKARDFIATLHVLAAGDAPEDRLEQAVRAAFRRFVMEARLWDLSHKNLAQGWVVALNDTLTEALTRPHSHRFEMVRSFAHELAIEWLREN
jgi:hypothetical protein